MSYTVKHLLSLAKAAVDARGYDFTEPRTQFLRWDVATDRWIPCSLAGHLAVACEVPLPELVRVNSEAVTSEEARPVFARRFTHHAIDVLQTMQRATDRGESWGEAVDAARARWIDLSVPVGRP